MMSINENDGFISDSFLKRWKEGIRQITPLQTARITYQNTWIVLAGILCGIVASILSIKQYWWLLIILVAALVNTIIVQIGNYQKYAALKTIEENTGKDSNETQ